jgi:hypothetical protein
MVDPRPQLSFYFLCFQYLPYDRMKKKNTSWWNEKS